MLVLGAEASHLARQRVGLQALLHHGEAQRDPPDGEDGEADDEHDEEPRQSGALRRALPGLRRPARGRPRREALCVLPAARDCRRLPRLCRCRHRAS